jgi:CheY-like chemotaxis protein
LLRIYGHAVRVAADGPGALEAVRVGVPDVVLLDIGLPKMDGYEVVTRLLASCGDRRPYLVAHSGYRGDEAWRRSARAGSDLHLMTPADPEELQSLLAERRRLLD